MMKDSDAGQSSISVQFGDVSSHPQSCIEVHANILSSSINATRKAISEQIKTDFKTGVFISVVTAGASEEIAQKLNSAPQVERIQEAGVKLTFIATSNAILGYADLSQVVSSFEENVMGGIKNEISPNSQMNIRLRLESNNTFGRFVALGQEFGRERAWLDSLKLSLELSRNPQAEHVLKHVFTQMGIDTFNHVLDLVGKLNVALRFSSGSLLTQHGLKLSKFGVSEKLNSQLSVLKTVQIKQISMTFVAQYGQVDVSINGVETGGINKVLDLIFE